MEHQKRDPLQISTLETSNPYSIINNSSVWLEIRLFYVRIAPCSIDTVPDHLTLSHLRREIGFSLEINGSRVPASDSASFTLRRDRIDRESSEVTYLSTDSVRVTGGFEFEVYEKENLMLCGSLERMEGEWSMDCYMTATVTEPGNSSFFQRKKGVPAPAIEVYIAGCSAGAPVILTKTILASPCRKGGSRALSSTLDAIPEDEEIGEGNHKGGNVNGLIRDIRHRNLQITEAQPGPEDYEFDGKIGQSYYSEEMYAGEDGQLTLFNAGVRVGVGIGLGMCLGVGIGVGLLMRSYQATTRNFRRRFF